MPTVWWSCRSEVHTGAVAVLIYIFITSLITAIFWKQIVGYVERKRREQHPE